ncbi:putative phosphatase [Vibrio nigripulchritudo ATCC 27043]|nr:putative phosphatase [Vibrio nigripulchritudo ATCC 27043]
MMESNDTRGVVALPGAIEFLNILNNQSVPWAIVTSGTLPVATARIKAANLPFPKVLITPEQVSQGKPNPEPYILGAEKLNVNVHKCIVFEDAPAGVKLGVLAGAKAVAS